MTKPFDMKLFLAGVLTGCTAHVNAIYAKPKQFNRNRQSLA
jgi:hypothetical protein